MFREIQVKFHETQIEIFAAPLLQAITYLLTQVLKKLALVAFYHHVYITSHF